MTYFALMGEFGSGQVELEKVSEKYVGLTPREACRRAILSRLPIPAFHAGGQKSPWVVSLADLAEHIDARFAAARTEWLKSRTGCS
jgi:Pyocin activator protein PrtN